LEERALSRRLTIQLTTSEFQAGLLLEVLTEKAKQLPSEVKERREWLDLARQVADSVVGQMTDAPAETSGS
jgi:hypothetical protein